jgi:hypothetical protein
MKSTDGLFGDFSISNSEWASNPWKIYFPDKNFSPIFEVQKNVKNVFLRDFVFFKNQFEP